MRLEKEFYVIVFDSTHHAIQTEKRLKESFQIEMIPTPREITASCGLSIKFLPAQLSKMMEALKLEEDSKLKVFKITKVGMNKHVTPVL